MTRHRLIGVVHIDPLPGTPFFEPGSLPRTVDRVRDAVAALRAGGASGALLQTADRVYSTSDDADPARVAAVTRCALAAAEVAGDSFDLGVQIMRHAVRASLAVAKIVGARFVRADALVGATLSTHGWVLPDPESIMGYRRAIDAFDIECIVDIASMHYSWAGEPVGSVAAKAMLVGADAVCIADRDVDRARELIEQVLAAVPTAPIFVGGFLDPGNAARLMPGCAGAFVSGCLTDPDDPSVVEPDRVRALVAAMDPA